MFNGFNSDFGDQTKSGGVRGCAGDPFLGFSKDSEVGWLGRGGWRGSVRDRSTYSYFCDLEWISSYKIKLYYYISYGSTKVSSKTHESDLSCTQVVLKSHPACLSHPEVLSRMLEARTERFLYLSSRLLLRLLLTTLL
jgi:hypothetical protein